MKVWRIAVVVFSLASMAWGQDPRPLEVLRGRPDAAGADEILGPAFESQSAGIVFRPPAGSKEIRRAVPDEIVQYVQEQKQWVLKLTRAELSQPMPLPDLLEAAAEQAKGELPNATLLRQEAIALGDTDVGLLVIRYSPGGASKLTQRAIIRLGDQLYYVLDFNTPGAKAPAQKGEDPGERRAAQTFAAIVDSIRVMDRGAIKEDQNQRLFRTRALLVNLTEKRLRGTLIPQQWQRLIRDGKDIGYTYIVEEIDKRGASEGVLVGIRSRTVPEAGVQVDAESWMFCTLDRRHEDWSSLAVIDDGQSPARRVSEFGTSDRRISRVLDPQATSGDAKDPKQPPVRQAELYTMEVTHGTESATAAPVTRDLPPWYMPQAIGHLLPRLVPTNEPKTYMFATYVSDQREVMTRYVDVGREAEVTLGGKKMRAVPIKDRLGLEGSITSHYVSPEGRYLGSVNADSKIVILPSDASTLEKLWRDADLTRPGKIEQAPAPRQGE